MFSDGSCFGASIVVYGVWVTSPQPASVSPQYVPEELHHGLPRLFVEWIPELSCSLHGPYAVQVILPGGRHKGNDDCQ